MFSPHFLLMGIQVNVKGRVPLSCEAGCYRCRWAHFPLVLSCYISSEARQLLRLLSDGVVSGRVGSDTQEDRAHGPKHPLTPAPSDFSPGSLGSGDTGGTALWLPAAWSRGCLLAPEGRSQRKDKLSLVRGEARSSKGWSQSHCV